MIWTVFMMVAAWVSGFIIGYAVRDREIPKIVKRDIGFKK